MTPREGAVVVGPTGVMYLLLRPACQADYKEDDLEEPCWECLKLMNGRFGDGREAELCAIRVEWLVNDAEEFT